MLLYKVVFNCSGQSCLRISIDVKVKVRNAFLFRAVANEF